MCSMCTMSRLMIACCLHCIEINALHFIRSLALLPSLYWTPIGWGQRVQANYYHARLPELQAAPTAALLSGRRSHVHRLCAPRRFWNLSMREVRQANFDAALERALGWVRSATMQFLRARCCKPPVLLLQESKEFAVLQSPVPGCRNQHRCNTSHNKHIKKYVIINISKNQFFFFFV